MTESTVARTKVLALSETQKQAILLIARMGPLSRSEIARRLPVGRSTLSPELANLVQLEILTTAGSTAPTGGRKGEKLRIADEATAVIVGVDIDIDRATVAITDLTGTIIAENDLELEASSEPVATLRRCSAAIRNLHHDELGPIIAIGLGIPADINPRTGATIATPTLPTWANVPIADYFASEFEVPTFIDNDANVLALAETAARRRRNADIGTFMVVKLSTGLGAGVVIEGQVFRGARGKAGDVGHIRVDAASTARCTCGNQGCLEAIASAPALVTAAEKIVASGASSFLSNILEQKGYLTLQDIGDGTAAGDIESISLIKDAGIHIGTVLAGVITFLDPAALIISSGLQAGNAFLLSAIRESIYQRALPELTSDLEITHSLFALEKNVFGPAILAIEGLFGSPRTAGYAFHNPPISSSDDKGN